MGIHQKRNIDEQVTAWTPGTSSESRKIKSIRLLFGLVDPHLGVR